MLPGLPFIAEVFSGFCWSIFWRSASNCSFFTCICHHLKKPAYDRTNLNDIGGKFNLAELTLVANNLVNQRTQKNLRMGRGHRHTERFVQR